jgi:hypothetical protein
MTVHYYFEYASLKEMVNGSGGVSYVDINGP